MYASYNFSDYQFMINIVAYEFFWSNSQASYHFIHKYFSMSF